MNHNQSIYLNLETNPMWGKCASFEELFGFVQRLSLCPGGWDRDTLETVGRCRRRRPLPGFNAFYDFGLYREHDGDFLRDESWWSDFVAYYMSRVCVTVEVDLGVILLP